MTRKLWFLLSAKGSSWFDSVFKPVHPELPRGWTLLSCLCCAGRRTLRVIYGGSSLACSGMRMACPLIINPTTRRAAGLPFLCPAFCSDMQTTHGPVLSQHPNLLFLPQTSTGTYLNAGCLCPHLSWLSAKGKGSCVRTNRVPPTSKNRFQILKPCLLMTTIMLEALYASLLELPVASAAILLKRTEL